MSFEDNVKDDVKIYQKGINYKTCCFFMPNGSFCGAYAIHKLPFPDPIPDMPLCQKHYDEYENSDLDTNAAIDLIMKLFERGPDAGSK